MLACEGVKVCIYIYIASGNARKCHRVLVQKGTRVRESISRYMYRR